MLKLRLLRVKNALVQECMAEFLGTFVLLLFGCSAAAQVKTSRETKGQFLSVNMAFSVGVMSAMYLTKGITGAHLNPAVTFSFCVLGRVPWTRLVPYSLSQVLGAYVASSLVYLVYYDAIMEFSGGVLTVYGPNETASIFATYPTEYLTLGRSFLDQVVGTGMLLLCILGLDEKRNTPAPTELIPPIVAVIVLGISMSMSGNCGAAINPARDLGPRLFTLTAGWGTEVFTHSHGPEQNNSGRVEMFRKKPPPEEERRVRANDREYNEKFQYASNCIMTSKYNIITFLPVNLFEQFQEVANTYFLFLLILQFRHKSDNQVNNRQSQVLIRGSSLQKEKWMNVRVGDIIKLENNQFVAADLLLLSSSEPHGLCYIETAELDGETNLKVRQSVSVTSALGDPNNLALFNGEVVCEPPNNKLDRFCGTLYWRERKYNLTNQNMLLRGCVLRNTETCYGLVIFAVACTKFKRTSIDRLMNTLVLWIFGFLVCMGVILAVGNAVWEREVGSLFQIYLPWDPPVDNFVFSAFLSFWSYVIILNTVVPISLYVSVEVIRLGHSYFINWDQKMFCSQCNTAAEARTTTLNEELGQVEYIFSDKTGTLTQNIMTFNKCSINGQTYGEVTEPLGPQPKKLDFAPFNRLADPNFSFYDETLLESVKVGDSHTHEFFRLLSLCHTVMSEEKSEGELVYKAQSPDEGALVTAARNFGFVFRSRTPGTITTTEMGRPVTYTLLAILDFNNIRKRMSVIVRNPEGRIRLYCKGADIVLLERLHPCNQKLMNVTSDHLHDYAADGLRTLALAYRDLSEDEWEAWSESHRCADKATDCREDRLAATYEQIEQDMMLLGATAIEDKLQEGVPETIAVLSLANIKIWVLTGDKQGSIVVTVNKLGKVLFTKEIQRFKQLTIDLEMCDARISPYQIKVPKTKDLFVCYHQLVKVGGQRHTSTQHKRAVAARAHGLWEAAVRLSNPLVHAETAVNIGYSCKMLTDDMTEVFIISGHTVQSVRQELSFHLFCASVITFDLCMGEKLDLCALVVKHSNPVNLELVFLIRRARERMIEHSRTRDGVKEERMEGWGEACYMGNGFKEGQGSDGIGGGGGAGGEKQLQCSPPPPPPSHLMDNIPGEFALVINGHSLAHALEADMEMEFVSTACTCKAVICCRVTPLQKAQVVELIKKHKKAVTLAIGDGANDVSMIKSAHIGVGISGQEGIQAVLASDYSFSQFRFLQRLLLVHGRWSYLRMCRFLCYFFYKNFAFTMVHFWFGFFCGFSAQTVYDQYFITLYNIVYTSLPVLAMGIFDQDVPDQRSLEYPKLYEPGQLNLLFNKKEFFICIAQGIYTSVVLFFVPYAIMCGATQSTGVPLADYQTFAVTTATALVIVVSVQIALDTGFWTVFNHVFVWGSLGSYFTIMLALHSSAQSTLLQPVVWLTIALATAICIVPVLAIRFLKLDLKPQLSDTVRHTQLVLQKKRKPLGCSVGAAWRGTGSMSEGRLGARGGSRRSGYAFAHQEGFGELITSGKNMRLSSLALATFASRHSSSWIDTLRRKKHTHTPPSTSEEGSPAPSCVSGSVPTLSNSSSVLGGSQDTTIEEETGTTLAQDPQTVPASSSQTAPTLATHSEAEQPQDSPQTLSAGVLTSKSGRCHEGDSSGGWMFTLGTMQEALFGWRSIAARTGPSNSPGVACDAKETIHIE
ncbi:Phospholipid-transporting ATPase ID [Channa argus]|uniref:Phospholipid-transporting ATPase n=1 Tax=Channa argus TaxID=215402 RepID=A0A6G1PNQ8_CHAAH|nr:Phospholipid-transporting ATPase ID [Channa argus]